MYIYTDVMALLSNLLETQAVIPQIDSEYSLSDAVNAVKRLESGRATGKVIIKCI